MATIDLTTPTETPDSLLGGLPRRVALTLPELQLVAELAGNAPLPFDVTEPQAGSLEGRMGQTRGSADDASYLAAISSLYDPMESLTRRGLLVDGVLDSGAAGAVGLLATPAVAVDLDVRVGEVQAKAWHREAGGAVATLGTVDGIVFELGWFDTQQWPTELSRAAVVPEDVALSVDGRGEIAATAVPGEADLPFDLASVAAEALRAGRTELLPVLIRSYDGRVLDGAGRAIREGEVQSLLTSLYDEARGRMRVLVTDVTAGEGAVVGVVSWVLVADGWRALRPSHAHDEPRVQIRRVEPVDLANELAPVLAEVMR